MLDYSDLIRRPHVEMGCVALCNEVLRRLKLPAVAPETDDEIARAVGLVRSRIGQSEWAYLGDDPHVATQLGDVVVTDAPNEEGELQLHTSVVVSVQPSRVLTSTQKAGVVAFRTRGMRNVVAVYRARK